ncbi:hypothetical protein O181_039521 [Austropuccinia psidii MF-1]|uniref:Uncharacterized protein n=1 Tax=Austropuccinia psidii MF-1 TaxID=1389203 RepID=A0A9Q3DG33_9BASI|nr:hypothetical protein [Austropuccinia psidii MF-1]
MHRFGQISVLSLLFCLRIGQVKGHLAMVSMVGETNGLKGTAFGELEGTPRNGTARFPFQADSGVVRQGEIESGYASVCGRTLMGPIDMTKAFEKAEREGLPDLAPGGRIVIKAHQINADGGGPYSCAVDLGATGNNFQPIDIEVNIPGANGRSDARSIDLPLVAKMPDGAKCTGGVDGFTCLVRCLNGAKAGPFGGCLAFTQKSGPPANSKPLPKDADLFSEVLAQLREAAKNEPVKVMPIAKKIMPQNLSPERRRRSLPSELSKRQQNAPQLLVWPTASRVTPTTQGNGTPAVTTFGTNLNVANGFNGPGVSDNNGGNGHGPNQPPQAAAPKTKLRRTLNFKRQTVAPPSSYVATIKPTTEGILFEGATGPLGQADVPQNVRKDA